MLSPGHESPDCSQKSIENDIETEAKMKAVNMGIRNPSDGLLFQWTLLITVCATAI